MEQDTRNTRREIDIWAPQETREQSTLEERSVAYEMKVTPTGKTSDLPGVLKERYDNFIEFNGNEYTFDQTGLKTSHDLGVLKKVVSDIADKYTQHSIAYREYTDGEISINIRSTKQNAN